MKMNSKQISGLVAFIAGIALIIFSMYEKHRIDEAKGNIEKGSSFFSDSAAKDIVGGALKGEVEKYDMPVLLCLIAGVVLVVVGAGATYVYRRK